MNANLDIAKTAQLIGDKTRVNILLALFNVDALPASDLARRANISPQTASSHLSKLLEGNLINLEKHGRHRYYHLASPEVAQVLESLMTISKPKRDAEPLEPLEHGRRCYDHLAGRLGVSVTDAFLSKHWLEPLGKNYDLTSKGKNAFTDIGISLESLQKQRRQFARQCLDWTERRHHLAGSLGAAVMDYLLEHKWILSNTDTRVIHVTPKGQKGLKNWLDISL